MAKGKAYDKWWEKQFKAKRKPINEIEPILPLNPVHTEPTRKAEPSVDLQHPVHGYFIYECERCGTVYQMYLDKGLEDKVQDKLHPDKHKPVPFTIVCRNCTKLAETLGGSGYFSLCRHILWGIGDSDEYEPLPQGASYFKNDPNERCGIPVVNAYYRDLAEWHRHRIKQAMSRR